MKSPLAVTLIAAVALGTGLTYVSAQNQDNPNRGQRRQNDGRQGGQRFDPQQMQQRMMEMLKERLNATDEEWEVLEPRVQAVLEAQRETRVGGMGMMGGGRGGFGPGGRGGPGGPDAQQNQSELAKAVNDLRTALEDDSTPNDKIGEQLESVRSARQKAEAELDTAQSQLQELLTQRQEGTLVLMGMLD